MTTTALFSIGILLTLCSGLVTLIASRRNTLAQVVLMGGSLCMGYVAMQTFVTGEMLVLPAFFVMKSLEAFFVLLIALGSFLAAVFACGYLPRYRDEFPARRVNSAMSLFVVGMYAVVLATSLPVFLVAWELMSVSAYFLIIADRSPASLSAGLFYFIMTHIGLSCLLAGFGIFAQGSFLGSWEVLRAHAETLSLPWLTTGLLLLFAGFGSKAGLVPLHGWLPHAHPQAPSHASALLSGVMLPVAFFGFVRVLQIVPGVPFSVALVILICGLLSAVFGALYATTEHDVKKLLAYSSIEHMGLIFAALASILLLGSVGFTVSAVTTGLVFFIGIHIVNHFFFKVGLFFSYGAVTSEIHTRNLDDMGGLAQTWPRFSAVVLLLSLAAAALPPTGVFLGEWALVQSLVLVMMSQVPLVVSIVALAVLSVVGLSAGLALFAAIKMFSVSFLGRARTEHSAHAGALPLTLTLPPLACALGVVMSGLVVGPFLSGEMKGVVLLAEGVLVDMWLVAGMLAVFALVGFFIQRMGRGVRVTDTWDCGAPLTPRMQYTATGFAAPIRFFFRTILGSRKHMHVEPVTSTNTWIARRTLTWEIRSFWEDALYSRIVNVLHRISEWVRRIQNGVVQLYILVVIITLILTTIIAL